MKRTMLILYIVLLVSVVYAVQLTVSSFDSSTNPFNITTVGANETKYISIPIFNLVNFSIQMIDYSDTHTDVQVYYDGKKYSLSKTGLIHVFRMDNEIKDTLTGQAFVSNNLLTNATGIRGLSNTALSNNGSDAQLTVNDFMANGYDEITFCMWLNTTQVQSDATILTSRVGGTPYLIMDNSSNRWRIYVKGKNTNSMTFNNTAYIWNHVCYAANFTDTKIYHNGSIIYEDSENGTLEKNVGTTQLFNYQSSGPLNGTIDEFYFWNRTLSPDEILDIYNEHNGTDYPINWMDTRVNFQFNETLINNMLIDNCSCTGCSIIGGKCKIPINFYSNRTGTYGINLTNLTYSFGIDNCSNSFGIDNNGTALNISFIDDSGNKQVVDFNAVFDYDLDTTPIHNYSTTGENSDFQMCVYPSWATFYSDIFIDYDNFTYSTADYILNNITKTLQLTVEGETTTPVTFTVLDTSTIPVKDAFIHINKWEPSTNTYTTTEVLKTDALGQAVGNIVLTSQYYRFIITFGGETKLQDPEIGGVKIYVNTRTFTISTEDIEWYEDYDTTTETEVELTFNSSGTNYFDFTWSNTETSMTGCLRVIKTNKTGSSTLSDSCTSGLTGSAIYQISPTDCDSFSALAYFDFEGDYHTPNLRMNPYIYTADCEFSFADAKGTEGKKEVLFFAWMFVFALALIGMPFPELSFGLAALGMVATIALRMWDITWIFITPIIVIGLIYLYKGQRK